MRSVSFNADSIQLSNSVASSPVDLRYEAMPVVEPKAPAVASKIVSNVLGEIITVSSIVPSGLFAALLVDKLFTENNAANNVGILLARIVSELIVFSVTVEPKRRLMRAFNTQTFNDLVNVTLKDLLAAENVSLVNVINTLSSVLAGLIFGGLAYVSVQQLAAMLGYAHVQEGDDGEIAQVCYFIAIAYLSISSFIANALSFPTMQRAAVGLLQTVLSEFLLSFALLDRYFKDQAQLAQASHDLMRNFKNLVQDLRAPVGLLNQSVHSESSGSSNLSFNGNSHRAQLPSNPLYKNILNALQTIHTHIVSTGFDITIANTEGNIEKILVTLKTVSDEELIKALLKLSNQASSPHHPWISSVAVRSIGFALTALCIAGLSNFYSISLVLFSAIEPRYVAIASAAMVMISMSLLAFIQAYAYGALLTDFFKPSVIKIYPEVLTPWERSKLLLGNGMLSVSGSLPNTYQALVLAQQSLFFVGCAFLASFSLEFKASYAFSRKRAEDTFVKELTKEVPFVTELFSLVKRIDALTIAMPSPTWEVCCPALGSTVTVPEGNSVKEPLLHQYQQNAV